MSWTVPFDAKPDYPIGELCRRLRIGDFNAELMSQAADALDQRDRELAELRAKVSDSVAITLQLGYDHWLKHGTPIKPSDAPLVTLTVEGRLNHPTKESA